MDDSGAIEYVIGTVLAMVFGVGWYFYHTEKHLYFAILILVVLAVSSYLLYSSIQKRRAKEKSG